MNLVKESAARTLSVSDEELEAYRDAANPYRHIRDISSFQASVEVALFQPHLLTPPDSLPWPKTHGKVGFRKGEVTLWPGINGHGKSAVTTQVALNFALEGKPVCIASFEMAPVKTIERMLLQCAGNSKPTESFSHDFFKALTERVWIYDKREGIDRQRLYAVIRYAAIELGVRHFFIDSLMKCVKSEEDYDGQKEFVGSLCNLAHELSIHIHLVHHVRKARDESDIPSKFDAKGSGAITDQVDNVITVWRNKEKERKLQMNQEVDETMPEFLLVCDKQRNGAWEGKIALWGDLTCWHFRESHQQPWQKGYSLDRSQVAA